MTTLHFKNEDLKAILEITEQATVFRATYDEAVEEFEKKTGSTYAETESLESYYERATPTLWLIEDNGIFLMTSAKMDGFPCNYGYACAADGYKLKPKIYKKYARGIRSDDLIVSFEFSDQLKKGIAAGADLQIKITEECRTITLVFPDNVKSTSQEN